MEQTSTKKTIIKTAAFTLVAVVLATIVLAVIVSFCFPYRGYKLASNLGMKNTALFFAEKYVDNGNIDGLVYCIELDEDLLSSKEDEKYALKLIAHTERFFDFDNVQEYFLQLDDYYIKKSKPQYRVGLYSYNEYVVSRNYVARTYVGNNGEMLFRGKPTKLLDLFAGDLELMETATIYSALYRAIRQKGTFEPFFKDNSLTEFYSIVKESIESFVGKLVIHDGGALETLFLLRSVIYLIDETSAFLEDNKLDPTYEARFSNLEFRGQPLRKAYSEMYTNYIKNEQGDKINE